MTVAELIEELKKMPQDAEVIHDEFIWADDVKNVELRNYRPGIDNHPTVWIE